MKIALAICATLLLADSARAACINRFVARADRPRQVITLLTGKLTFQEARALSDAIEKKQTPPLEWVTEDGKPVARQLGELKVIRPMPVGCDGKSSGVVMIATFTSAIGPSKRMFVKFDSDTTVQFDEQSD